MKKSIIASILLIAVVLTGCTKDDNIIAIPELTNQELILGRWSLESISPGPELTACEKQTTFTFLEDGTSIQSTYSENGDGDCELFSPTPATYSFSADDLIRYEAGEFEAVFMTIVSISEDQLVLSVDDVDGITTATLTK